MTDEIFFGKSRFISAGDAARFSGFTRDYIAMLCRQGTLRGKRIGRNWYVDEEALKSFLVVQEITITEDIQKWKNL